MMEALAAALTGLLAGAGIWLALKPRTFEVVLGFTLLSYAVNLFVFFMGRLRSGMAPILRPDLAPGLGNYADPLPQALVLTAIVISFGMTAVLVALAVRSHLQQGTDHMDGDRSS
jgi:multicomponent K+:H+ antiporter subunit C